jgi:MFS family permease
MDMEKLWTKDFVVVSLENFVVYFTYYTLIATITVFSIEKFHASTSMAGLSAGIFILGAVFGRLFTGSLIDRVGWKKMLYFGFVFFLTTTLLYFIVTNLAFLIILRILHGAAFGVCSTATGTIAAGIIPETRRGEGTGYYALSTTLASAIGPFLGIFLLSHASFQINLFVCTIVVIAGILGVLTLKVPKVDMTDQNSDDHTGFKLSNYVEPAAISISFISAFIGLGFSSVLSFLTSYTQEINLVDVGSFFFITYSLAILISRPIVGRWFDKTGGNIIMYFTFILFALGFLLLSQAHHGLVLLLAGVFVGLGYGNFLSSAQAISIKVSPKHRMGLATSTFFMFTDVGAGIGPFVLGFLIQIIGFRGMYVSMVFLALACLLLYFFMHGKVLEHTESYR